MDQQEHDCKTCPWRRFLLELTPGGSEFYDDPEQGDLTMEKLYKLTDQQGRTYNNTQWGPGITHHASGEGELCGPGWIHAYTDPLLAVLLNPIHAGIEDPILWECEGKVGKTDRGLKVGCTQLTTIKQIPLPQVTIEQRVKFAILCALEVYNDEEFAIWAKSWISGKNRSEWAAATVSSAAARAEAEATARRARRSWAAAAAARVAARAAADAAARRVALAAADAMVRAAWAVSLATWAAVLAASRADIDLITFAHEACKDNYKSEIDSTIKKLLGDI